MSKLRLFDPDKKESLEHLFGRYMRNMRVERDTDATDIRVDLLEKNGSYKIVADIPGIKKDDITVRVDGNIVQIDAQTRSARHTKGNGTKVLRSERYAGHLSRLFTLAQEVDESKVTASYADGVLQLDLPKKPHAAASTKLIPIQ